MVLIIIKLNINDSKAKFCRELGENERQKSVLDGQQHFSVYEPVSCIVFARFRLLGLRQT
jgi:hypothetical protein